MSPSLTTVSPRRKVHRAVAVPNPLARALAPDLALLSAFVTVFVLFALFGGSIHLLRDADVGWHIRTGERILHMGELPDSDPFSLLHYGRPWFAWEWGAEVVMAALHHAGGLAAVVAFYTVLIAAATYLAMRLHWTLGTNFLLAAALMPLMLTTASLHWLARPHLLGWLFLLGAVLYAESGRRNLAVVFVAMTLWTNLHASFFLGVVVALIYAAGAATRMLLWDECRAGEVRWFLSAAAAGAAASLINPYGWALHRHLFDYLTDTELLARIGEFQSFNFHAEGSALILLTVLLVSFGCILSLFGRRIEHALLTALLLAMALRSGRALPLLALVGIPIAGAAITACLREVRGLRRSVGEWLAGALEYGDNLRAIDRCFTGWLLAPIAVAGLFCVFLIPAVNAGVEFPRGTYPVDAAEAVEQLPNEARILSSDLFGGYLIYRFSGQRRVYFDGRSDFYGASFMKEYLGLIELRRGWRAQLDKAGFTHAVLPSDYSLIPALEESGWRVLYRDSTATLLERK